MLDLPTLRTKSANYLKYIHRLKDYKVPPVAIYQQLGHEINQLIIQIYKCVGKDFDIYNDYYSEDLQSFLRRLEIFGEASLDLPELVAQPVARKINRSFHLNKYLSAEVDLQSRRPKLVPESFGLNEFAVHQTDFMQAYEQFKLKNPINPSTTTLTITMHQESITSNFNKFLGKAIAPIIVLCQILARES